MLPSVIIHCYYPLREEAICNGLEERRENRKEEKDTIKTNYFRMIFPAFYFCLLLFIDEFLK